MKTNLDEVFLGIFRVLGIIIMVFGGAIFIAWIIIGGDQRTFKSKPRPEQVAQVTQERAPDIFYILTSRSYINIDGDIAIILDYAKNGETQIQAVFGTNKERDAFIAHLARIGKVENK